MVIFQSIEWWVGLLYLVANLVEATVGEGLKWRETRGDIRVLDVGISGFQASYCGDWVGLKSVTSGVPRKVSWSSH